MATNYPKFDNKIKTQIDHSIMRQAKSRPATIMSFNMKTNLATIILDDNHSGQMGNIVHGVPCPVTPGIQSVAPETGTRCLVQFRDDNESDPYIVSYFEQPSLSSGFLSSYSVNNGIPKYMAR